MTAELRCNAATQYGCPEAFQIRPTETPEQARRRAQQKGWTTRAYPVPKGTILDRCPTHIPLTVPKEPRP